MRDRVGAELYCKTRSPRPPPHDGDGEGTTASSSYQAGWRGRWDQHRWVAPQQRGACSVLQPRRHASWLPPPAGEGGHRRPAPHGGRQRRRAVRRPASPPSARRLPPEAEAQRPGGAPTPPLFRLRAGASAAPGPAHTQWAASLRRLGGRRSCRACCHRGRLRRSARAAPRGRPPAAAPHPGLRLLLRPLGTPTALRRPAAAPPRGSPGRAAAGLPARRPAPAALPRPGWPAWPRCRHRQAEGQDVSRGQQQGRDSMLTCVAGQRRSPQHSQRQAPLGRSRPGGAPAGRRACIPNGPHAGSVGTARFQRGYRTYRIFNTTKQLF